MSRIVPIAPVSCSCCGPVSRPSSPAMSAAERWSSSANTCRPGPVSAMTRRRASAVDFSRVIRPSDSSRARIRLGSPASMSSEPRSTLISHSLPWASSNSTRASVSEYGESR